MEEVRGPKLTKALYPESQMMGVVKGTGKAGPLRRRKARGKGSVGWEGRFHILEGVFAFRISEFSFKYSLCVWQMLCDMFYDLKSMEE